MKHGKKYQDSAKLFDRLQTVRFHRGVGSGCVKPRKQSLTKLLKFMSDWALTPAMLTSRSVALLFCRTEPANRSGFWSLPKATTSLLLRKLVLSYVGGEDMMQKIQGEGWMDFDVVIATPDMMGVVGRLGKILGPRGLDAEPESWHRYPRCWPKRSPRQKLVRSSIVWTRPTSSTARSERLPLA